MKKLYPNAVQRAVLAFFVTAISESSVIRIAAAADRPLPAGTIGWTYYLSPGSVGHAATPEEACKQTAANHMGTSLLDMRARSGSLIIDCKYPHFLNIAGAHWYGTTELRCEPGFTPSSEGMCIKTDEPQPPLNCKPGQGGFGTGNPVMVSSGAKVQSETDPLGAVSGSLKFVRTYRVFRSSLASTSAGGNWSFWFDRSFVLSRPESDGRPTVLNGTRGDGSSFEFKWNQTNKRYESSYDKAATLEALTATYDDWLLVQDGQADRYQKRTTTNGTGYVLVSSRRLDGAMHRYTYKPDSLLLQDITDERGRKLDVTWGTNQQVASISAPEGTLHYAYDTPWGDYPSFGQKSRLISVVHADSLGTRLGTKQYHYEDAYNPFLLTGITDENGNRFASYAYDSLGRTVSSEHAGGVILTATSAGIR